MKPRTAIWNHMAAIWNGRGPYGAFVANIGNKMPRRFHRTVI